MRPARFEPFLHQLLADAPGVTSVQAVAEAGYHRHPRGMVVTYTTGARTVLQIVGTSRPGDDPEKPEEIIEGDTTPAEVPVPELFDGGKLRLSAVDEQLAALVLNAGSREVSEAEVYSRRDKPGAVRYGVTFLFHGGAKIFVYVVEALPAGRDPRPERAFKDVPAAV